MQEGAQIRAAGGLLWRSTLDGPRLALVHRTRYDDLVLPKGKLQSGEGWEHAALREVLEETGCKAELASLAGALRYSVGGKPKEVRFWNMRLVAESVGALDPDEVSSVVWLAPQEALSRLTHTEEARLLERNLAAAPDGRAE
jgi:8-oxo-dGTP diphosphatase